MKNIPLLFLLCVLLTPPTATAGVVIGGLRFIYPEGAKSLIITLRNTVSEPWLVQSKILPDDGLDSQGLLSPAPLSTKAPFIATPPLFLMKGRTENQLRIMYSGGLPADRESLFWLSVSAIPSVTPQGNSNVLIAFRQRVKLIWRPDSLKGKRDDPHWVRHNENVIISNKSPWYITLGSLRINGKAVAGGMVPPFSQRQQPWCPQKGKCDISWQPLDDAGLTLPRRHVLL